MGVNVFILGAGILCSPFATVCQTLCSPSEQTYFSCKIEKTGGTISLCGNIANGDIREDSWLQYRTRLSGKPTSAWPLEKVDSLSHFEGNVFVRYDIVDLRFVKGDSLIGIQLAAPSETNDGAGRGRFVGSVSSEARGKKPLIHRCMGAGVGAYYLAFEELNAALRLRHGDTDLNNDFFAGRSTTLYPR